MAAVLGLIIGVVLGVFVKPDIPIILQPYLPIMVVAALDALLGAARAYFEGIGARILGPTRTGAHGTPIFFLHPKDSGGVLTEIMETPKEAH